MSVRKSSHGTIFLIVSSGSPRALIASSLRSTSKKPFCPMIRSLHPPMTACGHRVSFAATWREEFFEVPYNEESGIESAAGNHYSTMSLDEIRALPILSLASPDAALFMWTTVPHLRESFQVLDAWGFEYKTNIVWVKDKIGLGYFVRNQHELLLVATR